MDDRCPKCGFTFGLVTTDDGAYCKHCGFDSGTDVSETGSPQADDAEDADETNIPTSGADVGETAPTRADDENPAGFTMWCKQCGFPLDGLSQGRCVQCEEEFDVHDTSTYRDTPLTGQCPSCLRVPETFWRPFLKFAAARVRCVHCDAPLWIGGFGSTMKTRSLIPPMFVFLSGCIVVAANVLDSPLHLLSVLFAAAVVMSWLFARNNSNHLNDAWYVAEPGLRRMKAVEAESEEDAKEESADERKLGQGYAQHLE